MKKSTVIVILCTLSVLDGIGGGFERSMSDEEFAEKRQEFSGELQMNRERAASGMPSVGKIVSGVIAGKAAEGLGIKTNDVLMRIGKYKMWGDLNWNERDAPAELIGISTEGEKFFHRVKPGIVGVLTYRYHAPETAFRRKYSDSGDEWAGLAELAILAWEREPVLARDAWSRAFAAGYPGDEFSDFYLLLDSINEGVSVNQLDQFFTHFPEESSVPLHFFEGIVAAAVSSGELDYLMALAKKEPDSFYWTQEDLKRMAGYARASSLRGESLLARARSLKYEIIGSDLVTPPEFSGAYRMSGPECFRSRMPSISMGPGMLFKSVAKGSTPMKNVHMTMLIDEFEAFLQSKTKASYFHMGFVAGNYDNTARNSMEFPPNNMALLKTGIRVDPLNYSGPKVPAFVFSSSRHPAKWRADFLPYFNQNKLLLDLIRIDSEVACYVNGVCMARMPVDPDLDDLSVYLTLTGCSLRGTECVVRRLLP